MLLASALSFCGSALAGTILLTPSSDTSLIEVAPSNNNGGQTWILSGTTQNGTRNRALLAFDLTPIPSNSVVTAATLTFSVTRQPSDGLVGATFALHRILVSWGEGTNVSIVTPGKGSPATLGEATWLHTFFPGVPWSAPGGASGFDFSPWESSFQIIYGTSDSPYVFPSTAELMADVQGWVNHSAPNYGWLLLCNNESTPFTARRFGSREDPTDAPVLKIEYLVPPLLTTVGIEGNQFLFSFTALPGQSYSLEYVLDLVSTNWQLLRAIPAPAAATNLTFSDSALRPRAFYRLSTAGSQ